MSNYAAKASNLSRNSRCKNAHVEIYTEADTEIKNNRPKRMIREIASTKIFSLPYKIYNSKRESEKF